MAAPQYASQLTLQARKGESDSTPDDILAMVKAQAQPAHRCGESCLLSSAARFAIAVSCDRQHNVCPCRLTSLLGHSRERVAE